MKKLVFSILACLFVLHLFSQNRDIEEIAKLNQDWLNAYIKKDAGVLDKIFADDFVLISPVGTKMTRKDILANLEKLETVSINIDSIDIRLVTDNVALVTAFTSFVLAIDGKPTAMRNCYQDVYVKRKNRWLAVAAHVTLLNRK